MDQRDIWFRSGVCHGNEHFMLSSRAAYADADHGSSGTPGTCGFDTATCTDPCCYDDSTPGSNANYNVDDCSHEVAITQPA
jgi:hypothetical protein